MLAIGKLRERGLRALCDDYYRRCGKLLRVEERELRDLSALERAVETGDVLVVLDERGEQLSSEAFARQLRQWMGSQRRAVCFAVGGADGVNDRLRHRADRVLSLGKMTFAHQLARVMLAEQLYRAVSILEGAPYHRG